MKTLQDTGKCDIKYSEPPSPLPQSAGGAGIACGRMAQIKNTAARWPISRPHDSKVAL